MITKVEVRFGGKVQAEIEVDHDADAEPLQIAATAHDVLANAASFRVGDDVFDADDCKEFWA